MNEDIRVQCVPSCERRGMTGATQLAALKEAGYKVTVSHQRRYEATPVEQSTGVKLPEWEHRIIPTGGLTRVEISWPDKPEEVLATGVAYCSNRDNYNRKLGLTIAIGRARKALQG